MSTSRITYRDGTPGLLERPETEAAWPIVRLLTVGDAGPTVDHTNHIFRDGAAPLFEILPELDAHRRDPNVTILRMLFLTHLDLRNCAGMCRNIRR